MPVGAGSFSKNASSWSVERRFFLMHINNVISSATTTSATTVNVPATAPLLAKKPFDDVEEEDCEVDIADVDVCDCCTDVGRYEKGVTTAVVATNNDEDVLMEDRVELDDGIVDVDGGRVSS